MTYNLTIFHPSYPASPLAIAVMDITLRDTVTKVQSVLQLDKKAFELLTVTRTVIHRSSLNKLTSQYHTQQVHVIFCANPQNRWGDSSYKWQDVPLTKKESVKKSVLDRCKEEGIFEGSPLSKYTIERGVEHRMYTARKSWATHIARKGVVFLTHLVYFIDANRHFYSSSFYSADRAALDRHRFISHL